MIRNPQLGSCIARVLTFMKVELWSSQTRLEKSVLTSLKAPYFYDPFKTGPSGIFQSTDRQEHNIPAPLGLADRSSRKSIYGL